ncbi:MAG TPA: hypothetical protein VJV23_09110 [Candidatus Polarisedimenticolia bacterium]|nr:hypothetical protein [Candidatus Polarisedimenticolia bacterium]
MKTSSRKAPATKTRKTAPPPRKKSAPVVRTANHDKAIRDFEEGLRLFQRKEYAKAIHQFETVIEEFPTEREVCDRARSRIAICRERTAPAPPRPREAGDLYYAGVMAANEGRLDEAAELLEKGARQDDRSDKAFYALAAVLGLKGDRAGAIENLTKAIGINPTNRTHALNDPDFDGLREDAEFMALLGKVPERDA